MEPDDLDEEGTSHCCHRVGVAEGYEVCRFGKAVHHGENDRLAVDLVEALDEVHGYVGPNCYVSPNCQRNTEGLQQTGRAEMFSLVLLACDAATHKVPDDGSCTRNEEVRAEPVECLLGALMSSAVRRGQELFHQRRGGGHINVAAVGDQIIYHGPLLAAKSVPYFLAQGSQCHVGCVRSV
jgi:hypothetical protein